MTTNYTDSLTAVQAYVETSQMYADLEKESARIKRQMMEWAKTVGECREYLEKKLGETGAVRYKDKVYFISGGHLAERTVINGDPQTDIEGDVVYQSCARCGKVLYHLPMTPTDQSTSNHCEDCAP